MKKQSPVYLALVIMLTAGLACNFGGLESSATGEQTPATAGGQTNPATTAPAQEAGSSESPPGPETIDLANPKLYLMPSAPALKFDMTMKYTGVDATGGAKEFTYFGSAETQTQPQTTQHFLSEASSGAGSAETAIIGEKLYIIVEGVPGCKTLLASSMQGPSMLESQFKLQEHVTGQAPRVGSGIGSGGIKVNGFVTDKYELSSANMVLQPDAPTSAVVYVARNGGFITLFESQGRTKMDAYGFDPNQFTDIKTTINYIPVEDGSLTIGVPAGCDK